MLRRLVLGGSALTLLALSTGCSLNSEGIAGDPNFTDDSAATGETSFDSTIPDTGVIVDDTGVVVDDTGVVVDDTGTAAETASDSGSTETGPADSAADTFMADTFVADTFMPDTFVADTSMPDTTVVDTFLPDTFLPDTSVVDTGPEITPIGLLTVTHAGVSGGALNVNLSTEGTIDWAHWGYTAAGNWNHKGGVAVSPIAKGTLGTPNHWPGFPTTFSWTGGTPTAAVTDTRHGIYHDSSGDSFTFDVAGDATGERVLKVYLTYDHGTLDPVTGTIGISLTDSSATAFAGAFPPSGAMSGSGIHVHAYTIRYRPVAATGRVTVKVTQTSAAGYLSLLAATLRGP